ncbi:sulfurtransferase [candidate division BRC1 bacterium HGW-BRC1-1]|nr:MAG: sulfurtransferase [candidate division BRC1 bacterium HGW-BRC1-1]
MSIGVVSPAEVHQRLQEGEKLALIDVRTPGEHGSVNTPSARLVPLDIFKCEDIFNRCGGADAPIALMCKSGMRARRAAEMLMSAGASNVMVVDGGMDGWSRAGLPVIRGKSSIGVDRQVRIVAGGMALAGGLLAVLVNPAFAWLSAFVGAGLVMAGLTDFCPMAIFIAKMPWNRSKDPNACFRG